MVSKIIEFNTEKDYQLFYQKLLSLSEGVDFDKNYSLYNFTHRDNTKKYLFRMSGEKKIEIAPIAYFINIPVYKFVLLKLNSKKIKVKIVLNNFIWIISIFLLLLFTGIYYLDGIVREESSYNIMFLFSGYFFGTMVIYLVFRLILNKFLHNLI